MVPERRWRRTVFLGMPNRVAISLNGTWSRMCQRRIMPSSATSITPIPHSMSGVGLFLIRGSVRFANYAVKWVRFRCKSTGSRVDVVCEPSGAASIVIRFDVRNDNIQFLALICRLARSLECAFFSSDTRVIAEPTETGLGKVIDAVHNAIVLRNLKMG